MCRTYLSGAQKSGGPSLINLEVQLRKCCNHPFTIDGVEERELAMCQSKGRRPLSVLTFSSCYFRQGPGVQSNDNGVGEDGVVGQAVA